ncbi:MAG: hypothetical protein ACW98U_10650 [Candidatus Thorarchaeota archaeon]|jgi:hypothetical protein
MTSVPKPKISPTFRKVLRKLLKDERFYAALVKNPKDAIGYYAGTMKPAELNFLKNLGKTDVKKEFNVLKNLIESTRPPRPPAWI